MYMLTTVKKLIVLVLQALMSRGANINARNVKWATSLMLASEHGHLPVVEVSNPIQVHCRCYFSGADWFDCLAIYMFTGHNSQKENCVCFKGASQSWGKYRITSRIRGHFSDACFPIWSFACSRGKLSILNTQQMLFVWK